MKELIKNCGIIIILIGVIVLGLYGFGVFPTTKNPNLFLEIAAGCLVVGFISHIIISKKTID